MADAMAYRMTEIEYKKRRESLISNDGLKYQIAKLVLNPNAPSPKLDEVATTLKVSKSTFIRRLSDAGTSFKEIVDGVRQEYGAITC